MYFIHLIWINYSTNLTYFPIFLYFVDFSKVAEASPLAAAAAANRATVYTMQKTKYFFLIKVIVLNFAVKNRD